MKTKAECSPIIEAFHDKPLEIANKIEAQQKLLATMHTQREIDAETKRAITNIMTWQASVSHSLKQVTSMNNDALAMSYHGYQEALSNKSEFYQTKAQAYRTSLYRAGAILMSVSIVLFGIGMTAAGLGGLLLFTGIVTNLCLVGIALYSAAAIIMGVGQIMTGLSRPTFAGIFETSPMQSVMRLFSRSRIQQIEDNILFKAQQLKKALRPFIPLINSIERATETPVANETNIPQTLHKQFIDPIRLDIETLLEQQQNFNLDIPEELDSLSAVSLAQYA